VVGQVGPSRVRCVVRRDGSVDSEAAPLLPTPNAPARLAVDAIAVDTNDAMLFHKTTVRQRYVEAAVRHPGADDVLLVNRRGEVTETTIANLAVRLDGRWWTPPLSSGLLPGIERAVALADGRIA